MIDTNIILPLITFLSSVVTGVIGYSTGKRKRENEADKTAFEAYNYAIESLRREMENRVGELQRRIEQLEEENKQLRIANFNLMQNEKR